MPPRKSVPRANTRRPNQRRTIPANASRGPPKNAPKRTWTASHDLQLLQAFALAFKHSKLKVWPRVRRDPRFQIFLGPYSKNDLMKKYNEMSARDQQSNQLFFNHQIVPLVTPQRRAHIPLESVPLSSSTAPLPPLFGPRFGICDSDDDCDFDDGSDHYITSSSVPHNRAMTGLSDYLVNRIEATSIDCVKFKVSTNEYQTAVMLARNQYNKDHPDQQIDQATLPPVNGIKYIDLPPLPPQLLKYADKLPTAMRLISPHSFFPTMQDEYRFAYQQAHFYYTHRTLPMSLQHCPDLYYSIQQRIRTKIKRVGENGDIYPYQDIAELYYEQQGISPDEWNKKLEPRYLTRLSSLKTYLNNIIGLPLWYSIVLANYLYLFHEAEYSGPELVIQPLDLVHLHAHTRNIVNIILHQHFAHYPSVFGQQVAQHNAKERFQAFFVGGGRHVDGNDMATNHRLNAMGAEDADITAAFGY